MAAANVKTYNNNNNNNLVDRKSQLPQLPKLVSFVSVPPPLLVSVSPPPMAKSQDMPKKVVAEMVNNTASGAVATATASEGATSTTTPSNTDNNDILKFGFNQEKDRIVYITRTGAVYIYDTNDCKHFMTVTMPDRRAASHFGYCDRSNFAAVVCGSIEDLEFTNQTVCVLEFDQKKFLKLLKFRHAILQVRMLMHYIVTIMNEKITWHDFSFIEKEAIEFIPTRPNPNAVFACVCVRKPTQDKKDTKSDATESYRIVMATFGSGKKVGTFSVYEMRRGPDGRSVKTAIMTDVKAHETELVYISLNSTGTRLATASETGTIIRIWDLEHGPPASPAQEVRRGLDTVRICCIEFSFNNKWLAVSSTKGTIHVYSLNASGDKKKTETAKKTTGNGNPVSWISSLLSIIPENVVSYVPDNRFTQAISGYLKSERSYAQYHLTDFLLDQPTTLLCFDRQFEDQLLVFTTSGCLRLQFLLDHAGGSMHFLTLTELDFKNT